MMPCLTFDFPAIGSAYPDFNRMVCVHEYRSVATSVVRLPMDYPGATVIVAPNWQALVASAFGESRGMTEEEWNAHREIIMRLYEAF